MDSLSKLLLASYSMATQPISERRVALDNVDGFGISTVLSEDQGYETALGTTEGKWRPVDRYTDKEAAQVGHLKWGQWVRDGNRDFTRLGYDDLADPEEMTLS